MTDTPKEKLLKLLNSSPKKNEPLSDAFKSAAELLLASKTGRNQRRAYRAISCLQKIHQSNPILFVHLTARVGFSTLAKFKDSTLEVCKTLDPPTPIEDGVIHEVIKSSLARRLLSHRKEGTGEDAHGNADHAPENIRTNDGVSTQKTSPEPEVPTRKTASIDLEDHAFPEILDIEVTAAKVEEPPNFSGTQLEIPTDATRQDGDSVTTAGDVLEHTPPKFFMEVPHLLEDLSSFAQRQELIAEVIVQHYRIIGFNIITRDNPAQRVATFRFSGRLSHYLINEATANGAFMTAVFENSEQMLQTLTSPFAQF